jgi:uncharacterized protein with von Willebrand factor type A (vWA) domain
LVGPADLYWAGQATLLTRQDDLAIYDRVFHDWFEGGQRMPTVQVRELVERAVEAALGREDGEGARNVNPGAHAASPRELLRGKSFQDLTEAELAQLAVLVEKVSFSVPVRRSRRALTAKRGSPDLRATVTEMLRKGDLDVQWKFRARRTVPRRLVLMMDVSGSMEAYTRGLMIFANAALVEHPRWEAFCFGTRLTRVTRALTTASPEAALRQAADEVFDWDGGTRIAGSLRTFIDDYGRAGMARGAVVVICSDGLETDDAAGLGQQMERLARLAHRVIWLNPLKALTGYAPLAGGMRHALPYVDTFASGHNLASLETLAHELAHHGRRSAAITSAIPTLTGPAAPLP